jgi:acyl-CoA thioester hydrolase
VTDHHALPAPAEPFDIALAVQPDDIDELGHVNNVVYLRWVQEAAVAHWQAAADPADQAALAWVVVRHEIDYLRAALPDDAVLGRTWVGTVVGRDFERHTEIRRARDHKLLARARTLWCPVDRVTGRRTEPSPAVRARFSVAVAAG